MLTCKAGIKGLFRSGRSSGALGEYKHYARNHEVPCRGDRTRLCLVHTLRRRQLDSRTAILYIRRCGTLLRQRYNLCAPLLWLGRHRGMCTLCFSQEAWLAHAPALQPQHEAVA